MFIFVKLLIYCIPIKQHLTTNKFIDMDEEGIAEYKFITYFC